MIKKEQLHRFWLWLRWGSYNRVKRFSFDRAARGILKTPRVRAKDDGCVIVSLVSHRDLWMYLVSAKSFAHFFQQGRFVVINDGSLTEGDMRILREQIPEIEIKQIGDISNTCCPKGGCWERLLCVSDYVKDHYVIVLDADMLTQREIPEIKCCVQQNQSFIMGLKRGQNIQPMKDVWGEEVSLHGKLPLDTVDRLQNVFDTNMDMIRGFENFKYLKGSGGFNGFAKGSFVRADVEKFSQSMTAVFGKRWNDWGTEQIAVCFLIANSQKACILPYPKYAIYYANSKVDYMGASVLHFVGMSRFKNGFYKGRAVKIIRILSSE